MKTIGIIGGTGWISTLEYYRLINDEVNQRLGGFNSAKCILYSFNFADIDRIKKKDPNQKEVGSILIDTAQKLKTAGADCQALCANTFHMFADELEKIIFLSIIHIADATAQ